MENSLGEKELDDQFPQMVKEVHKELAGVIENYSEVELKGAFVVVEADAYRFRKPLR